MDVTSLLNTGSGAMVERRDSIDQAHTPLVVDGTTPSTTPFPTPSPEKTPSRRSSESCGRVGGRTPWDAGGYSLPLSLDTKNLQTSAKPFFYFSDSPIETANSASPKSPKHKCSDSQSSLSSYTSSVNSVSHSRISSLSTVSEFQPLSNVFIDMAGAEKTPDPVSAVSCPPAMIEVSPPSPVMEESPSGSGTEDEESQLGSDHGSSGTLQRPQSPSDAIMITRLPGEERRGSQDSIGTIVQIMASGHDSF
ncbi:uncharacterized protein MKZ38_001297 [Zalerion maritima]|uniref:Uncharacterized protein n=1 Tax=Zalerion maritima TaxID=339359 RepID=A0AAD5RY10_9PEZI|nr:uncharacterized protein MKZ38_001297 [Zalerion maritima]